MVEDPRFTTCYGSTSKQEEVEYDHHHQHHQAQNKQQEMDGYLKFFKTTLNKKNKCVCLHFTDCMEVDVANYSILRCVFMTLVLLLTNVSHIIEFHVFYHRDERLSTCNTKYMF